ncbi:MAG: hypothetical protein WAL04_12945 [Acidimicrobiales bacterium]
MVRLRSVAPLVAVFLAPRQARHLGRTLFLTAVLAAAGCSSAAARSEPSNLGDEPSSSLVPTSLHAGATTATSTGSTSVSSRTAAAIAVEMAWAESKESFYQAALVGNPHAPSLLATLVRGGPVYVHSIAYLSALASAGVRGPPKWRIGNEHVVSISATRARVEGCLFDTGSVWKVTGAPAPASLGGGPGLTASDATLLLVRGRWLVLADHVSAVRSPKEPGPCHGF